MRTHKKHGILCAGVNGFKIDNFCVPICSYESINEKLSEIFKKYSIRAKFNELKTKAKL